MIRKELRYGPAIVRLGDRTEDRGGKPVHVWYADAIMETATGRIRVRAEVDETVIRALYARAVDYSRQAAAMLGFDAPRLPAGEDVSGYEGGWDFFKELDQLGKSQVFKDITRTVDQVIQSPEMRAAMNFVPYGELIRQGVSLGTGAASGAAQGGPAAALKATLGRGLGMIPGLAPPALPPRPTYGGGGVISGEARRPLPGPARATARMVARVGRAKAGDPAARASLEEVGRMALRGSVPHQKAAALAAAMAGGPALSEDVAGWLERMAGCYEDADEAGAERRRRRPQRRRRRRPGTS